MAQFAAYRNPNPLRSGELPLLLDVQTNLLESLGTRVVVPLCNLTQLEGKPVRTLMPVLEIEGDSYVMLTPQLAGIRRSQIGPLVADLTAQRDRILAALDILITGI
jgi:toxin CcdB